MSPDPLTATPRGASSWPAPAPPALAAHELVHTSTPVPPTSLPNARTNTPACENSAIRLLSVSATYTSPDPLTANATGKSSWLLAPPALPGWQPLAVVQLNGAAPTPSPNARTNAPACENSLTRSFCVSPTYTSPDP